MTRPLSGSKTRAARAIVLPPPVNDVIMVVAAGDVGDPGADRRRLFEAHRSSGDGSENPRRDQAGIDGRIAVGNQGQLVAEDVARPAGQVEVAVMGQVDHRRLVGLRLVGDDQLVAVGQDVGDDGLEVSGVALLAVPAEVGEPDADAGRVADRLRPSRGPCRIPSPRREDGWPRRWSPGYRSYRPGRTSPWRCGCRSGRRSPRNRGWP